MPCKSWVRLLRNEEITLSNIETAPLRVVAAVLQANANAETDASVFADAAVIEWTKGVGPSVTLNDLVTI